MTPISILHKLGLDVALLFRDFENGGLSAREQDEFKKQQAVLTEVALLVETLYDAYVEWKNGPEDDDDSDEQMFDALLAKIKEGA